MLLTLTFGKALLIFIWQFIILGLALSTLEAKTKSLKRLPKPSHLTGYAIKALFITATTLLIYVLARAQLQGALYKISTEYVALMTAGLLLTLLYTTKARNPSHAIFLLLLFGVALFLSHIRINDIFFGERTQALYAIIKYHHWDVRWHYVSPFYNPLPIDLALVAFIHYVLGLDFIEGSGLRLLIFNAALVLALALNMLVLLK